VLSKSVDQMTTSIGNLMMLRDAADTVNAPGTSARVRGFDGTYVATTAVSNLAALIECAGAASIGKSRKHIKGSPSATKVDLGFDGNLSEWVRVARYVSGLAGNPLDGFFAKFEHEFRTVASVWAIVRNSDYHEPPPLSTPDHDQRDYFVGVNEAKEVTRSCYQIGYELLALLGAVPLTALAPPR